MKKIIAVAALMAVTAANAQDLSFGDVNYFLKQGQLNFLADVNHRTQQFTTDITATNTVTSRTEGNFVFGQLGYGLSDRLNLTAGVEYAFNVKVDDTYVGAGVTNPNPSSITQDGLANPQLGVNYRFLSQTDERYNWDFGALASIRIEDAETGSSNPTSTDVSNGNASNGRSSIEINTRFGRKWNEANEWQLAAGLIHNLDGEYTIVSSGGDTKLDVDASQDFFLRATYQYRPVHEFMMSLMLQATQFGSYETQNQANATDASTDSRLDLQSMFTAKYLVTSNFIVKFRYGLGHLPDFDQTDLELRKRRSKVMGIGIDWLF